jgi:hypothetical protein
VLSAWEFLERKVFFLVEQAIKKSNNPEKIKYLTVVVFKAKRIFIIT